MEFLHSESSVGILNGRDLSQDVLFSKSYCQACFLGSEKRKKKTALQLSGIFWDFQVPFLGLSGIFFGVVRQLFGDLYLRYKPTLFNNKKYMFEKN